MDLSEMTEFSFLRDISQKNPQEFIDSTEGFSYIPHIFYLLKINHFINITGECWVQDIILTMTDRRSWQKRITMSTERLVHKRFLRVLDNCKIRGKRVELTNKGTYMIDQYMVWIREEERKIFYQIKLMKKKVQESKEND